MLSCLNKWNIEHRLGLSVTATYWTCHIVSVIDIALLKLIEFAVKQYQTGTTSIEFNVTVTNRFALGEKCMKEAFIPDNKSHIRFTYESKMEYFYSICVFDWSLIGKSYDSSISVLIRRDFLQQNLLPWCSMESQIDTFFIM